MEYMIVTDEGPASFSDEVTRRLDHGWELYGPLVVGAYYMPEKGVGSAIYTQALIRPGVKFQPPNTTQDQKKD